MDIFQFPVSALLAVSWTLLCWLMYKSAGVRLKTCISSWKAGALCMAIVAAFMAVEGTWAVKLHTGVPFLIAVLALQLCLAFAVLTKLESDLRADRRARNFVITHLGMYLMVWASFWGAPDVQKGQMILYPGHPANIVLCDDGLSLPLPFSVELKDFGIETYEDGVSPRQYRSDIVVRSLVSEEDSVVTQTAVNSPCRHMGYSIYQAGYDVKQGGYSVIQLVRDPWLPLVYLGMLLLFIGFALMIAGRMRLRILLPAVLVLSILFTIATVAKINFGTLAPALRSFWFVPHIMVYMVAYSAMAIALLLSLSNLIRPNLKFNAIALSDSLMRCCSILLLAGMLCGCVWAKQAWGDYWAWDPKENWAAVTWLLTLVYLHTLPARGKRAGLFVLLLLLTFLSLQITWYGVNYLPSASHSMHTYNR